MCSNRFGSLVASSTLFAGFGKVHSARVDSATCLDIVSRLQLS